MEAYGKGASARRKPPAESKRKAAGGAAAAAGKPGERAAGASQRAITAFFPASPRAAAGKAQPESPRDLPRAPTVNSASGSSEADARRASQEEGDAAEQRRAAAGRPQPGCDTGTGAPRQGSGFPEEADAAHPGAAAGPTWPGGDTGKGAAPCAAPLPRSWPDVASKTGAHPVAALPAAARRHSAS